MPRKAMRLRITSKAAKEVPPKVSGRPAFGSRNRSARPRRTPGSRSTVETKQPARPVVTHFRRIDAHNGAAPAGRQTGILGTDSDHRKSKVAWISVGLWVRPNRRRGRPRLTGPHLFLAAGSRWVAQLFFWAAATLGSSPAFLPDDAYPPRQSSHAAGLPYPQKQPKRSLLPEGP